MSEIFGSFYREILGYSVEDLINLEGAYKGLTSPIGKGKGKGKGLSQGIVKGFIKPLPSEVTEYGKSIGFNINGDQFCSYYASKGWLIGKSPMKDWKAAVRTWKIKDSADKPQDRPATHRFVKLRCSNCGAEINTKIDNNRDVNTIPCKNCDRGRMQEIL